MATVQRQASAPAILLTEGMLVKLEAIDPATGQAVANVTATGWAIYGESSGGPIASDDPFATGPFMLVPGPDSSGA